jgi:hypothetical protein
VVTGTLALGSAARTPRVASTPSTFGIDRSMRTTSGSRPATAGTDGTVTGLADDGDVLLGVEQRPDAGADESARFESTSKLDLEPAVVRLHLEVPVRAVRAAPRGPDLGVLGECSWTAPPIRAVVSAALTIRRCTAVRSMVSSSDGAVGRTFEEHRARDARTATIGLWS